MTTAAATDASVPGRRHAGWLWAPAVAAVALLATRHLIGLGATRYDVPFETVYEVSEFVAAVLCLARAVRFAPERWPWFLLGLAQLASFLGDLLEYTLYGNGAYPSPGLLDVFWLSNYPLSAAGLALLVSIRFPRPEPARWLEGLQATMIVAALGLLVVFQPVLDRTSGTSGRTIVLLSYPLLDIVLMGAVLAVFAMSGFRPGLSWFALGAGLALFVAVDSAWAVSNPDATAADLLVAGWPAAHFLVALAAWLRPTSVRRVGSDDWRTALLPQAVVVLTIAIQFGRIFGFLPGGFPAARAFLVTAQVLVLVKLAAGPRGARRANRRDPLTGLGNRRALEADLARALRPGAPPLSLALCEVRGLDAYARTHGRDARDELLRRVGARLADAGDAVYRVEAGEFWLLGERVPGPVVLDGVAVAVASAALPAEAADVAAARALVERRLAALP